MAKDDNKKYMTLMQAALRWRRSLNWIRQLVRRSVTPDGTPIPGAPITGIRKAVSRGLVTHYEIPADHPVPKLKTGRPSAVEIEEREQFAREVRDSLARVKAKRKAKKTRAA